MTGKDQRSRQGRRGRRGGRDSDDAALQVSAIEESDGASSQQLPSPRSSSESQEAEATPPTNGAPSPTSPKSAAALPTIFEGKRLEEEDKKAASAPTTGTRSPTHKLLAKVPTPVRSPRSDDITSKNAGAADRSSANARGPEPWGAADVAAKGGYREWLQARGQQAMQRSLMQGAPGARQQGAPSPPVSPAACPAVAGVLAAPAAGPQVHLQRWFGAGGLELSPANSPQSAVAFSSRPPVLLPGTASPLSYAAPAAPLNGQPSPLGFGALSQPTLTYHSSTAPTAAFGVPTQPPTPTMASNWPEGSAAAAQQSGQKECNQEELMALLTPGGLNGLDSIQLAAQLRAVAPCSYED